MYFTSFNETVGDTSHEYQGRNEYRHGVAPGGIGGGEAGHAYVNKDKDGDKEMGLPAWGFEIPFPDAECQVVEYGGA